MFDSSLGPFHSTVRAWFEEQVGTPTRPQIEGWPLIRSGANTLIAAPTGSGKTLAAFLAGLDTLLRQAELPDETRLLYISPLKALGNDVQKNLEQPLRELRERDPSLPQVRVVVRSGDTPARVRSAMTKRPPQIVVTTPESLYILLTSDGGRRMLSTVRTVIVDEIHALAGSKRGSHLSLSLERLDALTGDRPLQRIGLSATQKPIESIARFLVGRGRECAVVDAGHRRELDLAMEIPDSPLETVCSHDTWADIYERMTALIAEERTTLIFVNTRKLAERVSARLAERLGEDAVTSHHGSLSRERRLDAEDRLKRGELRALVATASLELGIDIGDVDLVIQVGATRTIATFLQRIGRAGHGVGRIPKGRLFPLTRDEVVEGAALLRAVHAGELDRIYLPEKPLDILAQHLVAACVPEAWEVDALFELVGRAWPYRDLTRDEFDAAVDLHTGGRLGLLHRDGVGGRVLATKRARLPAITSGGAIPDNADYRVLEEPSGTLIGTINEDFAIESNQGDIFQLGTTSWQILKLEPGILRVVSAKGAPPTLPFWLGEAPARSAELSQEYAGLRETCAVLEEVGRDAVAWLMDGAGVPKGAAEQIRDYVVQGRKDLGASPSQKRIVIERFFDESGGAQLVVHCPFGGRINRAYGLALRKRFCRGFGFELQAAANEDAILLSLGPQHSFPLEEVFDYLNSKTARELLIQALLAAPMFTTRWRWNVTRALVVPRSWGGKRVPSPILRMRATDALVAAFPQAEACFETLPPGDMEVPLDHPLVRQTIEDCLNEAMDIEGFLGLLRGLEDGSIERVAVDTPEPSVFALAILNANPYAFLDDAPLEERRAQAVSKRRGLSPDAQDTVGALDPAAIERVRGEVWPEPVTAEEVHEVLTWMGYVTSAEAPGWLPWLEALHAAQRVDPEQVDGETRWFAAEASRDPLEVWRGRLEVLGPIQTNDAELFALENEGVAMRVRYEGKSGWCHRRLLARIQRYTLNALRREIEPVTAAVFWRFLAAWQHATPERQLEGPQGTYEVIQQLAGFEAPAAEWERSILPARVRNYRRSFLDDLTLSGRVAWGRLWSAGAAPVRTTPLCLLPRDDLDGWLGLAGVAGAEDLVGGTGEVYRLLKERGAQFAQDLQRRARLLPEHFEGALGELITRGLVSSDSYAGLRALVVTPAQRRYAMPSAGRWSLFRDEELDPPPHEELCRALLRRTGVVFKRTQAREKLPVPWRELHRTFRHLELRGEVRGGRFVSGFSGEQFALPEAIRLMRKVRKIEDPRALSVSAADPLNYQGILTPAEKVARTAKRQVVVVG